LNWFLIPQEWKSIYATKIFQITKAEMNTLKFDVVYEGIEPNCEVHGLKPNTTYTFTLRFANPNEESIYIWSDEFVEIQATTEGNM
jgi:hypothetical protein